MPRSRFSVRTPRLPDIPGMVRVATQAFTETTRRPTIGTTFVGHFTHQDVRWCRVAVENGRIIGYLTGLLVPQGVKIGQFAVHPGQWRRGVGRAMIASLEKAARAKSLPAILVGTNYARGFYEKCGFRVQATYHRLTRVLAGCAISPGSLATRPAALDNVSIAIDNLPRKTALAFLDAFYSDLAKPACSALYTFHSEKLVGCGVLSSVEVSREFCRVGFLYGRTPSAALQTLRALEFLASGYGYMWLGTSVYEGSRRFFDSLRQADYSDEISEGLPQSFLGPLQKAGYGDLQLSMWCTTYFLTKKLR